MTSGFPNSGAPTTPPGSERPSLWLRLRTRWKGIDLDAKLAEGVDPGRSPELSLRARQLASPEMRAELAWRLRRAVEVADRGFEPAGTTARVPIMRTRVRACRQWLLQIAERLRDERELAVKGLAMTARLVEDRRGPLFADSPPAAFERTVRSTLVALDTAERFEKKLQSWTAAIDAVANAAASAAPATDNRPVASASGPPGESGEPAPRVRDRHKLETPAPGGRR